MKEFEVLEEMKEKKENKEQMNPVQILNLPPSSQSTQDPPSTLMDS